MKVVFDHREELTSAIKTFWFRPEARVKYQAGQFTEIRLPHPNADERGDKRWFTLFASPTEPMLAITTKLSNPGSSFKKQLVKLKPGTELHLADPMGDFVLPKDKSVPMIFVAGGLGITPMRSMIKYLTDASDKRQIELIYVTATPQDQIVVPLLRAYCQKLTLLNRQDHQDKATLTAERIINLTKPKSKSRIYLSGPEPMIEDLVEQFKKTRIRSDQLVTDYFPGYKPV